MSILAATHETTKWADPDGFEVRVLQLWARQGFIDFSEPSGPWQRSRATAPEDRYGQRQENLAQPGRCSERVKSVALPILCFGASP